MIKRIIRYYIFRFSTSMKRASLVKKWGLLGKIGDHCEIHNNVSLGGEPYLIELGDYVRITNNVQFITHDGGVHVLRNLGKLKDADIFGKIVVGNNVHIGVNTIIMPGVTIGDNCIIGVGAVVTKDIPDNSIAVGVPARVISNIEEYYSKHKDNVDYTKQMNTTEKYKYLINKYSKL